MTKKAVILVSGGIDSVTVMAMAKSQGYEIYAMSFDYSQRHNIELEKAKLNCWKMGVIDHKIVKLDLGSFGGSSLTDMNLEVPKYDNVEELGDEIPSTYVPARNTIFLSYALGLSEIIGAHDIFIGVHAQDYSNYPDCRPEFIKAFQNMANLATTSVITGRKITIHTPLINMNKSEIIKTGLGLNVDYADTISCYDPTDDGLACGICHTCLLRLKGFADNNMEDPAKYKERVLNYV